MNKWNSEVHGASVTGAWGGNKTRTGVGAAQRQGWRGCDSKGCQTSLGAMWHRAVRETSVLVEWTPDSG